MIKLLIVNIFKVGCYPLKYNHLSYSKDNRNIRKENLMMIINQELLLYHLH